VQTVDNGYTLKKSYSGSVTTISAGYTDYNGSSKTVGICTYTVNSGYTDSYNILDKNGNTKAWNTYLEDSYGPYTIVIDTEPTQSSGT
jgi:hypothetical protein